jgi:hypothetical protein
MAHKRVVKTKGKLVELALKNLIFSCGFMVHDGPDFTRHQQF